ncbi:MAG: molybdopterin-dependent oxidoreductase [Ktedonobacteraceae bacterium]
MVLGTLLPIMSADLSFPAWLRITHFINILFIGLLIRSGIQILVAHPRLYWNDSCNPETAWLRLTRKKVPKDELYTSMDDEIPVTPWLAQPGKENLGLGRHWHFFSVLFWLLNGIVYVVLLFATSEWTRLVPTSWNIVPRALHTIMTYLTFHIPPRSDFRPYDPLQQLSYAFVVFLLAPFMLLTGATMSPAIEARFPWYLKLFGGRQAGRSLHFLSMLLFVAFIIVHTTLVLIVHFPANIRNIVFGSEQTSLWLAILIAVLALLAVFVFYAWSSWYSLRHKRLMQHALGFFVDPVRKFLLHYVHSEQHYKPSEITSFFWINGRPPVEEEFEQLRLNDFRAWRLHVGGEVSQTRSFSLDELRHMPKQTQITKHNCIQGWSGVAEWGGVPLSHVLDLCQPNADAKYVVFTSYQRGQQSYPKGSAESQQRPFYEVIDMVLARHPQTILAYEMNGQALPLEHGAPLRLRCETQLGYKMVKYLRSIEIVSDYSTIGDGQGGFREDVQYYGRGAEI